MPSLENIKCPVCGNLFEDGDDVVYCPDCGTPHHRECYKMAGRCVNANLHKSGYSFFDEHTENKPAEKKSEEKPANTIPPAFFGNAGEKENNEAFGKTPMQPFIPAIETGDPEEKIGEFKAKEYAAAIRSNPNRFLPKFKAFAGSKKKTSWNWCALLFGPYYLLFRKMYAQGIGLLCIQTAVNFLGSYFMSLKAPKFVEAVQSLSSKSTMLSPTDLNSLTGTADFNTAKNISLIMFGVLILIRIIIALFADKLYFTTLTNLIRNVNQAVDSGATLTTASSFIGGTQPELTGEKAKLFYLSYKGGTSMMAALLAYIAISIISML